MNQNFTSFYNQNYYSLDLMQKIKEINRNNKSINNF